MSILNIIYIAFAVLLLFGAAIFFHELGHYWVALKLGMKVEEFAIGMGPKICSWKRNGIVYSLRWIPAGGFVKLPQMITSEALEGHADSQVPPAPPLHKIAVAVAGPLMNVIFAFVIATLIYFVGLPTLVNPSYIGQMDPTSPEYKLGIREGDRVVAVNNTPVESWQDITFATITARTNVMPVAIQRGNVTNTYDLTASASDIGGKWLNLEPREHPIIGSIEAGMPASKVDLQPGDRVLSVNNVPTPSQERMMEVISNSVNTPCQVVLLRKGEKRTVTITPIYDSVTGRPRIGVGFMPVYEIKHPTPWAQVKLVADRTFGTISALIHSKQTGVKPKDLSGPVGILTMLAAWVNQDYRLALSFLVLLNINLAIINLLPIPVLDGGHITMAVIEKIRRRPLSPKFVEYITTGFALLLISFMLYITFFDVQRFPMFRAMFQTKTQIQEPQNNPADSAPAPAPKPAPAAPR